MELYGHELVQVLKNGSVQDSAADTQGLFASPWPKKTSFGKSEFHPSTSIFHPSSSIIFLSTAPVWASRGVLLGLCEGCINYSCLVIWPQGQRCQSRLSPLAMMYRHRGEKNSSHSNPVKFLLICTNHSVTSAQSHAGSDSCVQLHHVPAWLQASQG